MRIPLPDTEKDYLRNFAAAIFSDAADAEAYLYAGWQRLQVVLGFLDRLRAAGARQVLELGSNPYYLTLLVRRHLDLELSLANYFGALLGPGEHLHVVEGAGERHELRFAHFNLETDRFPYPDASFDVVVFAEILEHLLLSADAPVAEIRRVLRPGGSVILTTPNVARLGNLIALLKGRNIYDGYSANGPYGRHNREYTAAEVEQLLIRHGFRIVETRLQNIHPHPLRSRLVQALRPRTWPEHIFTLAQRD